MNGLAYILCTALVLVSVLGLAGYLWYRHWKPHALAFVQSGYTPPATSWFGKLCFNISCRFLVFMTVGKVTVVGRENLPKGGNIAFAANHQLGVDFAMVRRGAGRHFRMLTIVDELKGFFGVLSAFMGVISVSTKEKGGGAAAEAACVDAIAAENGALGIFPQGALLPDNNLRKEEFRPGIVRMTKAAALKLAERARTRRRDNTAPATQVMVGSMLPGVAGQVLVTAGASALVSNSGTPKAPPVRIVPMAILYRHDPIHADRWAKLLRKQRSMWKGMRNPKHWDPIFKLDTTGLGEAERQEIERIREAKLQAYKWSNVTNYGGIVVIGKPIDSSTLPDDPLEGVEVIRQAIAELLEQAKRL